LSNPYPVGEGAADGAETAADPAEPVPSVLSVVVTALFDEHPTVVIKARKKMPLIFFLIVQSSFIINKKTEANLFQLAPDSSQRTQ